MLGDGEKKRESNNEADTERREIAVCEREKEGNYRLMKDRDKQDRCGTSKINAYSKIGQSIRYHLITVRAT